MNTLKLVIFDCDGVLVESELIGCREDAAALGAAGIPITVGQILDRFTGATSQETFAVLAREHGVMLPEDFEDRVQDRIDRAFERELEAMAGVQEALRRIDVPVCVASSATRRRLEKSLQVTGLWQYFAPHIFSAQAVARGKPAPDLFLYAAQEMGAAPQHCLVIEDSVNGVRAARAAGMEVWGFTGGSHCGEGHATKLEAAGAVRTFARMADLPGLLAAPGRDPRR